MLNHPIIISHWCRYNNISKYLLVFPILLEHCSELVLGLGVVGQVVVAARLGGGHHQHGLQVVEEVAVIRCYEGDRLP